MSHIWDLAVAHPWAVALATISSAILFLYFQRPRLGHIPTMGSNGLVSYIDGYRFVYGARDLVQEGYYKFKGTAFKIAFLDRWQVILTTPEMINEMRLAKDEDLSFHLAVTERLQTKYTVGASIMKDTYHVNVIQSPLTRNLGARFDEVYDEIVQSFNDLVPANEDNWVTVTALPTVQQIVCRTSNRLFLGLPICREPEWVRLNIRYTIDVFGGAAVINACPKFLKPLIGRYLSPIANALRVGRKYLKEEIEGRLLMDDEHGKDYEGRPNDLISWLLNHASGEERTVDNLITRLLFVNIAAIHTSSNSFTQVLFNLAAYPQYTASMRKEVLSIVEKEGWTKTALNKMRKVDSFLKESARFEGISGILMNRKVANPAGYTFSNGLHLPYKTTVGVSTFGIHHDSQLYEDPYTFDGFRFSKLRDDKGGNVKHQMVATSLKYLNFGHGKSACPGRFFAVNELKAMLAHVLVTYDVTLDGDARPNCSWFGIAIAPDPKANLLFRRLKL